MPALIDCLLFPVVFLMLAPQLLAAQNRLYLLLLPILAALFAANLLYYRGMASANLGQALLALRLAIHAIIVLYVLKGGVLAPIFTGNVLREKGRGGQVPFDMKLETACLLAVLLLAGCDVGAAPRAWTGASALACALLLGWRTARWQGWRVADVPLLLVMHLRQPAPHRPPAGGAARHAGGLRPGVRRGPAAPGGRRPWPGQCRDRRLGAALGGVLRTVSGMLRRGPGGAQPAAHGARPLTAAALASSPHCQRQLSTNSPWPHPAPAARQ